MAVESVNLPISVEGPCAIPIADVREVPLAELCGDVDALRMVSRVMESMEGSARVRVAMFQSAI
jgi:FXSXX-COOH protein